MIEINLLPRELRRKKRKKTSQVKIPKKFLVFLGLAILGLILSFQLTIQLLILSNSLILRHLNKVWAGVQLEKKPIDALKLRIETFKTRNDAVFSLGKYRHIASLRLNILSDALTPGLWLGELSLSTDSLDMKGSCVSTSRQEMSHLSKFLNTIKGKMGAEFPRLELVSVQRNRLYNIEITNFVITTKDSTKAGAKR